MKNWGLILTSKKGKLEAKKPKQKKVSLFDTKPVSSFTLQEKQGYVISSAINNQLVDPNALAIAQNYCDAYDYQLIVGAERYQNPTSKANYDKLEQEYWWDPCLKPYLIDHRIDLFGDGKVVISGEVRQRATVRKPLNLFDSVTDGVLQILPFGKLHLKPCMRHVSEKYPSFLATTGSLTPYTYSHTAVGKRANDEHKMGFLVVEQRTDGFFNFRQLEIIDNEVYDLEIHFTPDGWTEGDFTRLVYGFDLHSASCPEESIEALVDLVRGLGCPELILGDLIDWEISHHKSLLEMATSPVENPLAGEFNRLKEIMAQIPEDITVVVPASNHHDHVEVWINKCLSDGCKDPSLWPLLSELAALKFKHPHKPVLQSWWESQEDVREIVWLKPSDSYVVNGVENGQHGHIGPKGSRGSVEAFAKSRQVMNHGHVHHATRLNDVMSSGVSGMPSEGSHTYANKGYLDWSITVIVQYINGSRSHLHCFGDSFI